MTPQQNQQRRFAETINRIARSSPDVVKEWQDADVEAQQCGVLLAGCMGAKTEADALNIGRKLRSEVVRVALRIYRARAALVEAEKTASKIVLPASLVLTGDEQRELRVMGSTVREVEGEQLDGNDER